MSLTESSTVTKSNVNPDVEVSSETFLSQNTHKEGMSKSTRDANLASDTQACPHDAAREKPSRKRRLEADSESEVSEKEDDEYADFKRFRAVPKHDEVKWDLKENLAKFMIIKRSFQQIFP